MILPADWTAGPRKSFARSGLGVALTFGALLAFSACGGSEPSGDVSNTPSGGAGAGAEATAVSSNVASPGTGFIMMSADGQMHLTEPSYVTATDCSARVSALGDADDYAGCMEIPAAAMCLRVSEGESDQWWECFDGREGCESAIAGHEVVMEVGGGIREIRQRCTETEMASVFASM